MLRGPRLFVCLLSMADIATMAQDPPGAVFHSNSQLKQVSVIAQDKQGKPVADLRREEFQIVDNGSPQEIRLFVAEKAVPFPPKPAAPGAYTNQVGGAGSGRSGYSVILIDNLFTDVVRAGCGVKKDEGCPPNEDGSANAKLRALRALRSVPDGEKIAVYAIARGLKTISNFTTDRDLLEQRLKLWKPSADIQNVYLVGFGPGCPLDDQDFLVDVTGGIATTKDFAGATFQGIGARLDTFHDFQPEGGEGTLNQTPNWAKQMRDNNFRICLDATRQDAIQRAAASNDEMLQIADRLSGIPGRKSLVWLSNRFIISPRALQKLNGAGVAIYPVDVDGVLIEGPPRPAVLMNSIAELTGGIAFHGRNDLDAAIREAIEDGRVSYTVGFYPPGDDTKAAFHRVEVRVSRPGVTLRYATNYATETAPAPAQPARSELLKTLLRPFDAPALPITASVKRVRDRLSLKAVVDVGSMELVQNRDRWRGTMEIIALFTAADGKPVGEVTSQSMDLHLDQAGYESALQHGLGCYNDLNIPANAADLKILFTSQPSGKIGTLTIPLPATQTDAAKSK